MGTASALDRSTRNSPQKNAAAAPVAAVPWWQSTFVVALSGFALYCVALPPFDIFPLAWFAAVPWVALIRRPALVGKRPYVMLWLASVVFHLVSLYWITKPHWATSIGWVALAVYLGFYFPVFIGLCRVGLARYRLSPMLTAPVVWVALDLVRAHAIGGFTMGTLSQTQYRWPLAIQIADLAGIYGLSFAMILFGACLASMLPSAATPRRWWPLLPGLAVMSFVLGYGWWRIDQTVTEAGPKIALIQGSIDVKIKHDPNQGQVIYDEYEGLSRTAASENEDLDLIVWPETMFPYPWFTFAPDFQPPADAVITPRELEGRSRRALEETVRPLGVPVLMGITTFHETAERSERYNTALFLDREGHDTARYDKYHLVAFGEYVPLADWFPWLYKLTPLPGGLDRGKGPLAAEVAGARISPNICYENTIPHTIRHQVQQLRDNNNEPDVLVNLTNDGWFWGSTELDMHLACAVFRAVECRKPFLIAANTGFSASIDSNGHILAQGKRRETDIIIAQPQIDHRRSWYLTAGDLPAGICLSATVLLALGAIVGWRRDRKKLPLPTV